MTKTMPLSRGILPVCCRRPGVATAAAAAARACGVCAGCSTLLLWLLHICKSSRPHLRVNWSDPFEDINAETWRRALFTFSPRVFGSLWGGCCMGILSVGTQLKCLHLRLLTRSWLRFALWNIIQLLFANLGFCGGLGLVAAALSLLTTLLALFVHLAYPRLPVSLKIDLMPSPPHIGPLSPTPLSAAGCVTSRRPRKAKAGKEKQRKRHKKKPLNPTTSVAANAEQHRRKDASACEMQHPEQQTQQQRSTGDPNQKQQQKEQHAVQQQQEDNQQQQEVIQHQDEETETPLQQKHAEGALRQQDENKESLQEGQGGRQHEEETPNDAAPIEGISDEVVVSAEERMHGAKTSAQLENTSSTSFSSSGEDIAADGAAVVAIAVHTDATGIHAAAAVTHATPADSGPSAAAHGTDGAAADRHAAGADASYAIAVCESHPTDDSLPPATPDSLAAAALDNCEDIAGVVGTEIEDAGAT